MSDILIEQNNKKSSENIQNNDMSQKSVVIINQNGLSLEDIKTAALDVYRAEEAKKYSDDAWDVIHKRVEEFVTDFLERAYRDVPESVENLKKPSIQKALLNAEKGYSIDETESTKDNYIEIMKSRLCVDDKSILQIFEDEAIKLIEKLTKSQMNYLTFTFLTYHYPSLLNCIPAISDYCNKLCQIYDSSFNNSINLVSLDAVGATLPLGGARTMKTIEKRFHEIIPGLFYKGQTEDEIKSYLGIDDLNIIKSLLLPGIWDQKLLQINALDIETLKSSIKKYKLDYMEDNIIDMYNKRIMSESEIKDKLIELNPIMNDVINLWNDDEVNSRRITPQGIIVAISNYNIIFDDKLKFEDYIK